MARIRSGSGSVLSQPLPKKKEKEKKSDLQKLFSAAGFSIIFGLLVLGAGLICFIGLGNIFSRLLLDAGLLACIAGLVLKLVEVGMKIMGKEI